MNQDYNLTKDINKDLLMNEELKAFIDTLHPSVSIISKGNATVMGHTVEAIETSNSYNQKIIWGPFSVARGKFKGKLANNANTEEVTYEPTHGWSLLWNIDPETNKMRSSHVWI